jgi:hypothetical protein
MIWTVNPDITGPINYPTSFPLWMSFTRPWAGALALYTNLLQDFLECSAVNVSIHANRKIVCNFLLSFPGFNATTNLV